MKPSDDSMDVPDPPLFDFNEQHDDFQNMQQQPKFSMPQIPKSRSAAENVDIPIMPKSPLKFMQPENEAEEEAERDVGDARPLYIKVHDYAHALDTITAIKSSVKECSDTLSKVNEFNKTVSADLASFRACVEVAQKSLIQVDGVLFKK